MNLAEVISFRPAFPIALGTGVSAESNVTRDTILSIAREDTTTIYKSQRAERITSEMQLLAANYSQDNWDGDGARRISEDTLAMADAFLRCLPFAIDLPEVLPETTGAVALEWRTARNRIFVVSIFDTGRLVFAGIFGRAKNNGIDFFADGVPIGVLSAIRRVAM